ncbi:Nonaspanin (TM9SF) [Macleaya cordata]|uniref:Transmembrane 9 superfamily member n=1 Tax=Macleaya cordata TaxID=56857 RepID=A0A200QHK1_MACCD|nr:Nonaspanin (TM9SF) [Macleaya cordata]
MAGETRMRSLIFFVALVISVRLGRTSSNNHLYSVGDPVPLFANKVGPLNNPSETYQYFDLPFCRPDVVTEQKESLGEVLNGDRLTNTLFELKFREHKNKVTLCKKTLTRYEVAKFRDAIKNEFYFQMYYDDLPLWGFIGKVEEESWISNDTGPRYYLFKHVEFDVLYNENRVIEIRAFCDPNYFVDITEDVETEVQFTYSVSWNSTSAQFQNRMDKYSQSSLLPQHLQVHWFSIINSVVIVALLTGFLLTLFMRTLKNDLTKYSSGDEEADKEDVGWKHLHGDVFRYPPRASLFCAILGSGTQLLTLVFFIFILACFGILYPYNRGALSSSLVVIYALTAVVAGYTAASFHAQLAGADWTKSVLLTGILYLGPLFLTFSVLNTVAISYRATSALPFGTIVAIFLIWALITIPLLILGGIVGYTFRSEFQAPCATRRLPSEIPPLAWYRRTPAQMFLGGLLPFSAIFIELHYIFKSLWGHKIYTVYGILFITFIILIILTGILTIGLTYFQLSAEDHEWWWRSILCGGSTSIFMYGYCIYFYHRSSMSGFLQLSFFFGYNACICYAFFLILGTIGFRASLLFVRHIYHAVKLE